MLLKDRPAIKKNLDQLSNLFKELDDESIKRKQTIEKLINDYIQKNIRSDLHFFVILTRML